MKSPKAVLVATVVPLLLTALPVSAGELSFTAPATERADQTALLLHQTARALYDSQSGAVPGSSSGKHISNLWLFPTADADTVFARYNLTSDGEAGPATEHLAVLTVRGNQILESRDLTSSPAQLASNEPAKLHWSAAIGTGAAASAEATSTKGTSAGVTNSNATNSSQGVSASPDWTAKIGTGTAASSTNTAADTKQASHTGNQPEVAAAHWTSRIGTGHALDATSPMTHASLTNGG